MKLFVFSSLSQVVSALKNGNMVAGFDPSRGTYTVGEFLHIIINSDAPILWIRRFYGKYFKCSFKSSFNSVGATPTLDGWEECKVDNLPDIIDGFSQSYFDTLDD